MNGFDGPIQANDLRIHQETLGKTTETSFRMYQISVRLEFEAITS
jgi:hypothetical protein